MEKFFCYTHPYMHYMVYGDNDGDCLLKIEQSNRVGGYFLPLMKDGNLYSTYIVEFIKDSVIYAAIANRVGQVFEIEFGGRKTSFGTFDSKKYKYVGNCLHPDFQYGLIEVGIKHLQEIFDEDGILIIGCSSNFCYKRIDAFNLNTESIFLSGGIGDVFAIDSLLSDSIKNNIKTVCYGTKQAAIIQHLLESVPEYNIQKHIVVGEFSVEDKNQCSSTDESFLKSTDFGITKIFPQVLTGHLSYNKSSWLEHTLCAVDVPDEYFVICPFTDNAEVVGRNFSVDDWEATLSFLNIKGIVLAGRFQTIPEHPNLINYSGKTNILESIEILKRARGYIGIDSCLSVLAAKLFPVDCIAIKVVAKHPVNWKRVYWAPHTEFCFLKSTIEFSHMEDKK